MMRFKQIGIAGLFTGTLGLGLGLAAPANAAPFGQGFATLAGGPAATTIAYGCGRGFAPGRYGGCRPIYRGTGYYGPRRSYGYYGPRYGVGLPGLRVGPYGAGVSFY